jgi:hypothetical protein
MIVKMPSVPNKQKTLIAAREKCQIMCTDKSVRIMADFSVETLRSRRAWTSVF